MIELSSTTEILLITFLLLQIKHFFADFVWQNTKMINEKGIYGARYGIYHSLIHASGTFLAFGWIHPFLGLIAALVDFLAHYHIDWLKSTVNENLKITSKDQIYWVWFGLDQLAHQLTYIALIGWIFVAN